MLRHSIPLRLPQCENLEIFNQETKTILDTVKENLLFLPPKPVPQFISGRNFTQVENDVHSDTLLERAEKILAEAKKVKIFETMSNATSLQVYVDGFDRYMLKAKAFMIDDEKIFERILNHLTLIIDLLKDNSYSSKREFYYSDKELFEYM
ncbi:DNA topoisomerase 6 subunit A [Trifolium repens]|nr:DNA topoisomerase 6 subunit A [Trifolium repens]